MPPTHCKIIQITIAIKITKEAKRVWLRLFGSISFNYGLLLELAPKAQQYYLYLNQNSYFLELDFFCVFALAAGFLAAAVLAAGFLAAAVLAAGFLAAAVLAAGFLAAAVLAAGFLAAAV